MRTPWTKFGRWWVCAGLVLIAACTPRNSNEAGANNARPRKVVTVDFEPPAFDAGKLDEDVQPLAAEVLEQAGTLKVIEALAQRHGRPPQLAVIMPTGDVGRQGFNQAVAEALIVALKKTWTDTQCRVVLRGNARMDIGSTQFAKPGEPGSELHWRGALSKDGEGVKLFWEFVDSRKDEVLFKGEAKLR